MADASPADTSAPLRVLWLIKGLGPGGAEMLLVNQARATSGSIRYEAGYLVPWKDHLVPALEAAGVPVTLFPCRHEWDLRWAGRLLRRLRRRPVDVIHVHSPYVAAIVRLLARLMPRSRRPALVYTEHNEWPRHDPVTRLANRLTFALDDADFAVSDQVRDSMPTRLTSRVEVLVHGIDLTAVASHSDQRDRVRAELGVTSEDVVVGIVANFRKEKAYVDWLEAAKHVPDSLPVRFVSVGQGPLEESMRRRVGELGLGHRVMLLGYRDDPLDVMSAFDVFTLSSLHEGLPVSLMDALALGLPVAATSAGGIPQAVSDGVEGLLVPPGQPAALAAAVERLVTDPELRRSMGRAARLRASEFDVGRALERIEATYRDVVRVEGPRP